jgi:hypothetical protein
MQTPAEFNKALAVAKGQQPTPTATSVAATLADWKELNALVRHAHELEARGVRFYAHPERGTLSYVTADGEPLPPADYKRFKGMHEPVVLVLREQGTLCRDQGDAAAQVAAFAAKATGRAHAAESADEDDDRLVVEFDDPEENDPPPPAPSPTTKPSLAVAAKVVRDELEPLFKRLADGEQKDPPPPADTDARWLFEAYARELKKRRRLEAALAQAKEDMQRLAASLGRGAAQAAQWLVTLFQRVNATLDGERLPVRKWELPDVTAGVYQDAKDLDGMKRTAAAIRRMPSAVKENRISSTLSKLRVAKGEDRGLLLGGLQTLRHALLEEDLKAIDRKVLADLGRHLPAQVARPQTKPRPGPHPRRDDQR